MDRYTGLEQMSDEEAEALALLLEREDWERDQQARAEYESWYTRKTINEAEGGAT